MKFFGYDLDEAIAEELLKRENLRIREKLFRITETEEAFTIDAQLRNENEYFLIMTKKEFEYDIKGDKRSAQYVNDLAGLLEKEGWQLPTIQMLTLAMALAYEYREGSYRKTIESFRKHLYGKKILTSNRINHLSIQGREKITILENRSDMADRKQIPQDEIYSFDEPAAKEILDTNEQDPHKILGWLGYKSGIIEIPRTGPLMIAPSIIFEKLHITTLSDPNYNIHGFWCRK